MLKSFRFIFAISFISFSQLTSCNFTQNSPEAAIYYFSEAIVHQNENDIQKYSTPEYYQKLQNQIVRESIEKAIQKLKNKSELILTEEADYQGIIKYNLVYSRRGNTRSDIVLSSIQVQCINIFNFRTNEKQKECKIADIIIENALSWIP